MDKPISSIMETEVFTCNDTASLEDVVEMMVKMKIGGVTIVDDKSHVVGFISDGDIMKAVAKGETRSIYVGDSAMVFYDNDSLENKLKDFKTRNVMELATRKVLCVTPDRPIDEVARILAKKKIKKLPVVDENGRLMGIARRSAIMRYIFSLIFEVGKEVEK